jgi:hypothetical protein
MARSCIAALRRRRRQPCDGCIFFTNGGNARMPLYVPGRGNWPHGTNGAPD